MHKSLVDFLNHGTTPFVGRATELEQLLSFLAGEDEDRNGLEGFLLLGEAGVGKSRLIETCIERISNEGRALLHIKLRPEGSASLPPLIAEAIERSPSVRPLFSATASPLESVDLTESLGRIRRIAALRRTSLIIEDIHLLDGERLHEFFSLLDSLRDEPIGLLVAARPLDFPARGILDAYLREEMVLSGLSQNEISRLWEQLFGQVANPEILQTLTDVTQGNGLALRSAMRGGVRASISNHRVERQGGEIRIDAHTFKEVALRNIHSLAEGLTADLDEELKGAAHRLAMLGEVFTLEGASLLIDNADEVVQGLTFKGILTHSTTPATPINMILSPTSTPVVPIAFTHSLLHHDLVSRTNYDLPDLIRVISSEAPLLTFLPYSLIVQEWESQGGIPQSVEIDNLANALRQTCEGSRRVSFGTGWERASLLLHVAELLFNECRSRMGEEACKTLEAYLLRARLEFGFRRYGSTERESLAERLYLLTQSSAEEETLCFRLKAIEYRFRAAEEKEDVPLCLTLAREGMHLADEYVALQSSREYLVFLHVLGNNGINRTDFGMLRYLEQKVNALMADTTMPAEVKKKLRKRICPHFFSVFSSWEEMKEREKMVEEISKEYPPLYASFEQSDLPFYSSKLEFFVHSAMFYEVPEIAAETAAFAERYALYGSADAALRNKMMAEAFIGYSREDVLREGRAILERAKSWNETSEITLSGLDTRIARSIVTCGLFTNDREMILEALSEFNVADEDLHIGERLLFLLWEERFDDLYQFIQDFPPPHRELAMICFQPPTKEEEIVQQYVEQFGVVEYHIFAILRYYNAFSLVERGASLGNIHITAELHQCMEETLHRILQFFAGRNLPFCMRPALERYGGILTKKERAKWEKEMDRLLSADNAEQQQEEHLTISLLDTITIRRGDGKEERVRGSRSRTLLGLLVANHMLRRPIDRVEFFRLASGVVDDPERARTSTNVAVLRLREVLGKEVILTSEGRPELNREMVEVDLLEFWERLTIVEEELHKGRLVKAREHVATAISLAAGRVPFPGLYEPLFEGLRDDIESRLRHILLGTTQRLLDFGDLTGAEELTQLWIEKIGEDPEVSELLSSILKAQGREG